MVLGIREAVLQDVRAGVGATLTAALCGCTSLLAWIADCPGGQKIGDEKRRRARNRQCASER